VSSSVAVGSSLTDAFDSDAAGALAAGALAAVAAGAAALCVVGVAVVAADCVSVVEAGARLADAGSEEESGVAVWPLLAAVWFDLHPAVESKTARARRAMGEKRVRVKRVISLLQED
jgi:hypothetical protein